MSEPDRRTQDDEQIPGVSDAARSARDVSNAWADGAATDLVGGSDEALSPDGPGGDAEADPAMEPVIEAGGGADGGFEQSEEQLVGNATDSTGSTLGITGDVIEEEAGGAEAQYGEADHTQEQGYEDA